MVCNCTVTEVWRELLGERSWVEVARSGRLKLLGGHGGKKVSAECCLHPRVLKEYLFVSINKDRGGVNGGRLYHSRGRAHSR